MTNKGWFSTGCRLLDEVLGGGLLLGRISNVCGLESTGKTLLAAESATNFLRSFPDGCVVYNETEAAFDVDYMRSLGIPVDKFEFVFDCGTVEEFFDDIMDRLENSDRPMFYVLDSLDALSAGVEEEKDGSGRRKGRSSIFTGYRMEKQRALSAALRHICRLLEKTNSHLMIVSQLREDVLASAYAGAKQYRRSGGKALDFYASQILWLYSKGREKRQVGGIERIYAFRINAKCRKNKIGAPFRECTFMVRVGYGIDDVWTHVEFLNSVGRLKELDERNPKAIVKDFHERMSDSEREEFRSKLDSLVSVVWREIENRFYVGRGKYG